MSHQDFRDLYDLLKIILMVQVLVLAALTSIATCAVVMTWRQS